MLKVKTEGIDPYVVDDLIKLARNLGGKAYGTDKGGTLKVEISKLSNKVKFIKKYREVSKNKESTY